MRESANHESKMFDLSFEMCDRVILYLSEIHNSECHVWHWCDSDMCDSVMCGSDMNETDIYGRYMCESAIYETPIYESDRCERDRCETAM